MKATPRYPEKEFSVFVVDDNRIFLSGMVRNLKEKLKCDVHGFNSAEDCLKNLDKKPSLIISDFFLDNGSGNLMNGDMFLNKLKKMHARVPVVIYSGNHSLDLAFKTIKLGAKVFVPKEEHGFERITRASGQILQYLNRNYEEKAEKMNLIGISSVIGLLIITVFVISHFYPDLLPMIFISAMAAGIFVSLYNIFSDLKFNTHFYKSKHHEAI